jgi:hypothetical protein
VGPRPALAVPDPDQLLSGSAVSQEDAYRDRDLVERFGVIGVAGGWRDEPVTDAARLLVFRAELG